MGWLLVMFDLPVMTSEQRKVAAQFRKDLLQEGYLMLQYSVYMRTCTSLDQRRKHQRRLAMLVPCSGNVREVYLTDQQWERSRVFTGMDYDQGYRSVNPKMPAQMLFWG